MPYIKRTVQAGRVREVKKYYTTRYNKKGVKRSPNLKQTKAAQHKVNERAAEDRLRWKINANFRRHDMHIVLHYYDQARTLKEAERDLSRFKKIMRRAYKKQGREMKYISAIETKRMTNIHMHLIVNKIDAEIIATVWSEITGDTGGVSIRLLDRRGNHAKLAAYLIKETSQPVDSEEEDERAESNRRLPGSKRYSCSRNLVAPEPKYEIVHASNWLREPRPSRGWELYRFDDGSNARVGWHDVTGYPFQEYFQIKTE